MTRNYYRPEGLTFMTAENREVLYSQVSLEKAAASGKTVEAVATLCDPDMSLNVDLGVMRGYIEKEEAVMPTNGSIKDIAVITRVGKPVCFKILGFETIHGETVARLSRRAAQEECLKNRLAYLVPGDIIESKVTHLEPFGAFVDIGCGIVSLMSIDCISVSRISHPRDRFRPGMFIKCVIKSIENGGERIYVSHKELLGTWEENVNAYRIGDTVVGTVRSIESYGIFVELTPNLAGLAEYREGISQSDTAAVYIKNIIPEKMKVKLVIVDSHADDVQNYDFTYYETGTHIDSWIYSPSVCPKTVRTDFN
ncbi:MAG: S1 RNA-binding domain-containing protein [Clostridia bacterium]|nr:S1 RNA-binding domain-containing protein [Clostridia bacterium]